MDERIETLANTNVIIRIYYTEVGGSLLDSLKPQVAPNPKLTL